MKMIKRLGCLFLLFSTLQSFSQVTAYEFTGGSGNDGSGNGYMASLFGNVANGDSLFVDTNITSYLTVPAAVLNGRLAFSVHFRIKFNNFNTSGLYSTNHLFSGNSMGDAYGFAMSYQKTVNLWRLVINDALYDFSNDKIVTNWWYCVCITRDASGLIRLYVDGIQSSSTYTNTTPLQVNNFLVGQETDCFGGCFASNQAANAKFDFIRFFNTSLSGPQTNLECARTVIVNGVSESKEAEFSVYPNPVSNELFINNAHNISSVEIASADGRVVFKKAYASQADISISMNDLAPGIYFLNATAGGKPVSYKIIKN